MASLAHYPSLEDDPKKSASDSLDEWIVLSRPSSALGENDTKLSVHVREIKTVSTYMGLSSIPVAEIEVSHHKSSWLVWRSVAEVERIAKKYEPKDIQTELETAAAEQGGNVAVHKNDRAHLEDLLRRAVSSDLSGETPEIRAFLAENDRDLTTKKLLPGILRLPRSLLAKVFSHMSHVDIVRAARVCRHFRLAADDEGLWAGKGFFFLSQTSSIAFATFCFPEPATYTIMVHGHWEKLGHALLGMKNTHSLHFLSDGVHSEITLSTRVSHSLVNIRFVKAVGADERGAAGRIVLCSSVEDEDSKAHFKCRSQLPQAVIIGAEEAHLQRDAALNSLLQAIVCPTKPDDEIEPYSVADYIGVLQVAARTASKAFVLIPCKIAPAIIVFGMTTGFGVPASMLSIGSSYAALALRAIWAYPTCAVAGTAVYGALVASPPVGRIHKYRWVQWMKRITDVV